MITEKGWKVNKKWPQKHLFCRPEVVEQVCHKKALFLVIQIRSMLSFSIVASISKLSPQYKTFFVMSFIPFIRTSHERILKRFFVPNSQSIYSMPGDICPMSSFVARFSPFFFRYDGRYTFAKTLSIIIPTSIRILRITLNAPISRNSRGRVKDSLTRLQYSTRNSR